NKDIDPNKIEIDLSQNGISLRQSVYKSVFLNTLTDDEIMYGLEKFLLKKLDDNSDYQKLLKYFEIPLLNAAKRKYKSQLQMANHLNLNRNTLRKKINLYLGDN
ncbi:MAG: Fis family transcriptional regulator, partial [Epsilonproteobacteria bacterium]